MTTKRKKLDFSHLNGLASAGPRMATAEQILAAGKKARGEALPSKLKWVHLLGGAPVESDEPPANVTAREVLDAGKRRRGEV